MSDTHKTIYQAIPAIMAEIGSVGKSHKNQAQNYTFRGIADIYLACQPVMAKHGVCCVPTVMEERSSVVTTRSGGTMNHVVLRVKHTFYAADGSSVDCVTMGEAMDSGDKACNKAMSGAMKYALVETFAIPEEDPDADTENASPELGRPSPPPKPASTTPVPSTQVPSTVALPEVPMLLAPDKKLRLQRTLGALKIGVDEAKAKNYTGAQREEYVKTTRLAWLSRVAGRAVESSSTLTDAEFDKCMSVAKAELEQREHDAKAVAK